MADWARNAFMILKSKRQRTEYDEDDFHFVNKRSKREGNLDHIQAGVTVLVAILDSKSKRKFKAKDKLGDTEKLWWADVYRNWSEEDFKAKMRIYRTIFNFILDGIYEDIILTTTNLKQKPNIPWPAACFNNLLTGYWLYLFHLIRVVWCVCVCC